MCVDQAVEILDRRAAQLDARHTLQLVELDGLAAPRLLATELCSLERSVDTVENVRDVPWVGVRLVEGVRQERARERSFVRVRPFCEPR